VRCTSGNSRVVVLGLCARLVPFSPFGVTSERPVLTRSSSWYGFSSLIMVCVCHLTLFLSVGMRGVACEVNCFCPRLDCSLWLGPRKSLSCAPRRVYFPRLCACSPFFFFNLLLYCCVVGSFGGVLFSLCLPGVHLNAIAIFIPPNTSLLVTNEAHDTFNVLEVFLDVCRHCAWRNHAAVAPLVTPPGVYSCRDHEIMHRIIYSRSHCVTGHTRSILKLNKMRNLSLNHKNQINAR